MTRAEIQAFFPSIPPGMIMFGGAAYAVPALEWLTDLFAPWFLSELRGAGVGVWAPKWECRDFARSFACLAQMENAKTGGTPEGADALAVGEFWFHPAGAPPSEDHAINACLTDKGLVFIEPQTGAIRPVTQDELLTCKFLRF